MTPVPAPAPGGAAAPGPGHHSGTTAEGPLEPGAPFGGRYRILRLLGAGGMGVVYQAWDEELGVAVALKVIRPEITTDPYAARDIERRFKRELLLARQVTHKHVVRIHDLGEVDGIKYLTMPFVEGRDLAGILREGPLPVPRALRFARQIAAGLEAAHDAGVVHRDLKPENIMIDADDQALIMDFGISRSATSGGATMTAHGAVVGTLEYMAPEQGRGVPVDHRADIYAFGLIVYDMIAGRCRLDAQESAIVEMMSRMQQAPAPLKTRVPQVPDALASIVMRCLEPDADKRFAATAELVRALEGLDGEGRPLKPAPAHWPLWSRIGATAAAVLIIALAAGVGLMWRAARHGAGTPAAREPVSVLIADFDNQAKDPVFSGALEQALGIAMEGASFISAYSRTEAQQTLSKLEAGATLGESGARRLAIREGIKVVLAGSIASGGSGYDLTVRAIAIDPRDSRTLAEETRHAASKDAVLEAVGSLAASIRSRLGDTATATRDAETFTAGSLDAVREYSIAQDLSLRGQDDEAIAHYGAAVRADPQFGRAYAGWAVSAHTLGRTAEAEQQWKKALSLLDRMTAREKYRTLGGYYLTTVHDYDQAIENYKLLVEHYPADTSGHANLALAYFYVLDLRKALEEGERAAQLDSSVRSATNYALYAMYASKFDVAEKQSRALIEKSPGFYMPYFPLAASHFAAGNLAAARQDYERMAATGPVGASLAALGLADAAIVEGRVSDAIDILTRGLAADEAAGRTAGVVGKRLALADAKLLGGDAAGAAAEAQKALAIAQGDDTRLAAARVLVEAGRIPDAERIAAGLEQQIQKQGRAYARIIAGEIALERGKTRDAVEAFRAARNMRDLWIVHFDLGRALLEAGATAPAGAGPQYFSQADQEFDLCGTRRGEAVAMFLDEMPTFRAIAPLAYWQGRAHEALGMTSGAAEQYRAFLAVRSGPASDPLVLDARKRLGTR